MAIATTDEVRIVRIETELRFRAGPESAASKDEGWGEGMGHLYAQITERGEPQATTDPSATVQGGP